jgi:hypothetical protein
MSIQFSNTSTKRGLVQKYEKAIGANYGDVTGDALLEFTAAANDALDNYLLLWAKCAGTWQGDDMNHTNYPVLTANIVSGQRDYPFTSDDGSNRITDVSKVLILPSATATQYVEISPIDELDTVKSEILVNTLTGIPRQYGKLSNSIFLDRIPNYSVSNGIKMIVNREGSYFTSADTTKVAGVPAYHEYFYLKPAMEYAMNHGQSNYTTLKERVEELEGDEARRINGKIQEFFGSRERDVRKRLIANVENTR